jgi:hypothetical protein
MSTRTKNKKEALAKVEGSWLSHIDVDGKRYHSAHLTNLTAGLHHNRRLLSSCLSLIISGRPTTHPPIHRRYWDLKEVAPWSIRPADNPLPSDCRYREDLQALLRGDEEEAQRFVLYSKIREITHQLMSRACAVCAVCACA